MKHILMVGAHPDDIEFGCGGLCVKLAGYERVHWLVMTHGGQGGSMAMRIEEQRRSAEEAHVESLKFAALRDTELPDCRAELIAIIEGALSSVKATELYLPFPCDTHQDHRAVTEAGLVAGRWVDSILFYESYGTYDFMPDVFVTLNEQELKEKENLLRCHGSQIIRSQGRFDILAAVRATAKYRGLAARKEFAEGYKAFRLLRG